MCQSVIFRKLPSQTAWNEWKTNKAYLFNFSKANLSFICVEWSLAGTNIFFYGMYQGITKSNSVCTSASAIASSQQICVQFSFQQRCPANIFEVLLYLFVLSNKNDMKIYFCKYVSANSIVRYKCWSNTWWTVISVSLQFTNLSSSPRPTICLTLCATVAATELAHGLEHIWIRAEHGLLNCFAVNIEIEGICSCWFLAMSNSLFGYFDFWDGYVSHRTHSELLWRYPKFR